MPEPILPEFKNTIDSIHQLNDAEWEFLAKNISIKKLPKDTCIHKAGDYINNFSFLAKGYLRFYFCKEEKEFTLQIFSKKRFIIDLIALRSKKPTEFYMETLTDCLIIDIDVETMKNLISLSPSYEKVNRVMYERALVDEMQRLKDVLSLTPFESYKKFISEYPELVSELTQVKAAKCINITQESYSRFKKLHK
jgi:CRP-like cAMP-binding protein